MAALKADGGGGLAAHAAPAGGAEEVGGPDLDVIVEPEKLVQEAVVELAGEVFGAAVAVEIRTTGVADEEGVAGEGEPGLVGAALLVGAEQRDAVRRVAGSVQDAQQCVAEGEDVAFAQRLVRVIDVGGGVEVDGRFGVAGEVVCAGAVVGVDVGLDDGDDARVDGLRLAQILVDERFVGIDDGELLLAETPEEVGGAAGGRVEELAEEHGGTPV